MMQQEFKMNSEKKEYCKPLMEVVEMDYTPSILECSGSCPDDADAEIEAEFID